MSGSMHICVDLANFINVVYNLLLYRLFIAFVVVKFILKFSISFANFNFHIYVQEAYALITYVMTCVRKCYFNKAASYLNWFGLSIQALFLLRIFSIKKKNIYVWSDLFFYKFYVNIYSCFFCKISYSLLCKRFYLKLSTCLWFFHIL